MNSTKLKASAVVISFFFGSILCLVLISALLSITSATTQLGELANYKIARLVAENGIENGIVKYQNDKNLKESGQTVRSFSAQNNQKAYYDLTIDTSGLSVGSDLNATNWLYDANLAREQKAYELSNDREFSLNLTPWFKRDIKERPQSITVYCSDSFEARSGSAELFNVKDKPAKLKYEFTRDGKLMGSGQVSTDSEHQLKIEGLGECVKDSDCRLNIWFDLPGNTRSFFKIKAESAEGIMASSDDDPGTIYIHSTGYFGGAKARLIYKYSSSGKNLGLFEESVYCDSECKISEQQK